MFIDSGVWIAAKKKNDEWHAEASKIVENIIEKKIKVKITDYILLEVLNFLERKSDHQTAIEAGRALLNSENVTIINIDDIFIREGFKLFEQYDGLSFTDATLASVMKELNDTNLISFDSGFDRVSWIKRYKSAPKI